MKKSLVALLALSAFTTLCLAQTTLARWTFETSFLSVNVTNATISGLLAEIGTGTASGVHASSSTVYSSPTGNGSLKSISANTWAVGDYWQFQTSTLGYSGVTVSWDQTSSNTGPKFYNLLYSIDGVNFLTNIVDYTVLANASPNPTWSSGTTNAIYSFSYDLSSITALDNAASVYFRLVDDGTTSANGGAVAVAGTDRVDNFMVVVPEPSTLALTALGGMLCLGCVRRWRKR